MTATTLAGNDVLAAFLSWDDVARQMRTGQAEPAVQRRAQQHPDPEIRSLAAKSLRHDDEAMAIAARDSHQSVRVAAARSPVTPADQLLALACDRAVLVRQTLARRADLDQITCLTLAQDQDMAVRVRIAQGPRPPHVLEFLLQDPEYRVQTEALTNPHLCPDTVWNLAHYGDVFQRSTLARHNERTDVLEVLAKDPEPEVRAAIIDNAQAPVELALAVAHRNQDLRRRVLRERHADMSADDLQRCIDEFLCAPDADLRTWIRRTLGAQVIPLDITEPPEHSDRRRLFEVVDRWLAYDLIVEAVHDESVPTKVRAELLAHPDIPLATVAGFMHHHSPILREAAARQLRAALYKRHRANLRRPRLRP